MEEHRFCYPTVIPLQLGATAHGPRAASLGQGAVQLRSSAAESVRPSTAAQHRPSTVRPPWSHSHLRAAFGGHS